LEKSIFLTKRWEKRETTAFGRESLPHVTGLYGATFPSESSPRRRQNREEKEEDMEAIYGTMIEVNRRE